MRADLTNEKTRC
ncbi:siderophore iron transporter 1 [Kluyveromyces marxianus]|uniref:Siderophore iron transporter 1 n=1 Tax=Kluyveromyces marxianus TaxID=4911 RepID=A0ABX6ESK1_KLUMA|nr:siderophore iron transporter 1 [Kluyveromyces marxianus]